MIQPVMVRTAASQKWSNAVEVVKYDVENPNTASLRALLSKLDVQIKSLPTLVLMKGGTVLGSRSGVATDMDVDVFLSSGLHRDRVAKDVEAAEMVVGR